MIMMVVIVKVAVAEAAAPKHVKIVNLIGPHMGLSVAILHGMSMVLTVLL